MCVADQISSKFPRVMNRRRNCHQSKKSKKNQCKVTITSNKKLNEINKNQEHQSRAV